MVRELLVGFCVWWKISFKVGSSGQTGRSSDNERALEKACHDGTLYRLSGELCRWGHTGWNLQQKCSKKPAAPRLLPAAVRHDASMSKCHLVQRLSNPRSVCPPLRSSWPCRLGRWTADGQVSVGCGRNLGSRDEVVRCATFSSIWGGCRSTECGGGFGLGSMWRGSEWCHMGRLGLLECARLRRWLLSLFLQ